MDYGWLLKAALTGARAPGTLSPQRRGLMISNAAKHYSARESPPLSPPGTRPQISHRMFPLLILVRQQRGNAYLHYSPAPRGAFPKPLTQRLISSYSLLSPSSSNWEQIDRERGSIIPPSRLPPSIRNRSPRLFTRRRARTLP